MIIGWGIEDGIKFWLCRNSYGQRWGEGGNFRVRRGADDFGIESEPSAYIPRLPNLWNTEIFSQMFYLK